MVPKVLGDIALRIPQNSRRLAPSRWRRHPGRHIRRDSSSEERPHRNHLVVPLHRKESSSLLFEERTVRGTTPFGDTTSNEADAVDAFIRDIGVLRDSFSDLVHFRVK